MIHGMQPPPAGQWPVAVGTEYDENGPELLCDAWTERAIITGRVISEPCHTAITGSTLDELRASLERHISAVRHVASPFTALANRTARSGERP